MSLESLITNQIKMHGPMPFTEFMQQALYHPQFGYYSAGLPKFGAAGDFITAPELSSLFGYTIANQLKDVLNTLENPSILEFGAGSGKLCIDVLTQLEKLNALPEQYLIMEVSATLKKRQFDAINQHLPHLIEKVQWLDTLPDEPFRGVMLANEVLDAMPVYKFKQTEMGLFECFVGLNENDKLMMIDRDCDDDSVQQNIHQLIPEGVYPYESELNPLLAGWIATCYEQMNKGLLLILDYGFPAHEYYHPDRKTGTLMCHHQHLSHPDPLIHIGEQDITAHVDFTAVGEAALQAGFEVTGYTNQGAFLLANDILKYLSELSDDAKKVKETQACKQLLQENEMGELFKVMALTKNLNMDLIGFQLSDKRHSL